MLSDWDEYNLNRQINLKEQDIDFAIDRAREVLRAILCYILR